MNGRDEALRRALRYPYPTPGCSFALLDGQVAELEWPHPQSHGREPLLAYGSNTAPEALARKLGDELVLARRARLPGFDVVYSAHVSAYGAIPATAIPSVGTEVGVFVLYLTPGQSRALALSEPNYDLARAAGAKCWFGDGGTLRDPPLYLSRHGCLRLDGAPLALADVPASGRRLAALTEAELLERLRISLAPEQSLEDFVIASASDPALARERSRSLRPS